MVPSHAGSSNAADRADAPLHLTRPRPIAPNSSCDGVLTQVIPAVDSGETAYWGCFPAGTIDQAYSPGIIAAPPTEERIPPSTVEFFSEELDGLEESMIRELDDGD